MDNLLGFWEVLPEVGKVYAGLVVFALLVIMTGLVSFTVAHFREEHKKRMQPEQSSESMIAPT